MICVSYQQNTDMLMSFQLKQFYKSTYSLHNYVLSNIINNWHRVLYSTQSHPPYENTGHDIVFGAWTRLNIVL